MKGEREDGGVALEDGSGAIALVHVTIDHGNSRRRRTRRDRIPLNDARGDGDIVEDTVACAVIGEGVMRAAGEVHGSAIDEREARRGNRSANAAPRPFDHRHRPWKSDPPLLFRRQRPSITSVTYVASCASRRWSRRRHAAPRDRQDRGCRPQSHARAAFDTSASGTNAWAGAARRSDRSRRLS